MASRNFNRMQSLNKEVKLITGRCDETGAKQTGLGFSTAKTGTGEYTITLEDAYPVLLSAHAQVQGATGSDFIATVLSFDVSASSKTVVIETYDISGGAAADLPASSQLHFSLFLQNSTVPAS